MGAYLENGALASKGELVMQADEIGVPGDHNVENTLATTVARIVRYFKPSYQGSPRKFWWHVSTVSNSLTLSR